MDSLTQIALGTAVGEAVGGRQFGRKAMLWGAICGTLPDLDVFISYGDAVRDFTYHRAASHSVFILALLTPVMVWLIRKIHPSTSDHQLRWYVLVYLVFLTHVLLDSFTVYGTQILWPLSATPVAWSTIFIIDPVYTIPLLIGVIAALISGRKKSWGWTANSIGLTLSSVYLAWTVAVKFHVDQVAESTLQNQSITFGKILTTPSPFNSFLWRIVAVNEQQYFVGYYSIFDDDTSVNFESYPRSLDLIESIAGDWPVMRLQWFTKEFYAVSLQNENIVISDLRMGLEPDYVFNFRVGRMGNPHPKSAPVERVSTKRDYARLESVWNRIWSETVKP